jgi:transcriptional regulator with XRE-family HTH domain
VTDPAWRRLADDFALELTALKAERAVTWDALAARAGVSKTYLIDLGNGRAVGHPSQAIIEKVAAALEVPADHFRLTRARAIIGSPKVIDTVYAKLSKTAA